PLPLMGRGWGWGEDAGVWLLGDAPTPDPSPRRVVSKTRFQHEDTPSARWGGEHARRALEMSKETIMAKKKQTEFGIAMRNFTKYPEMPSARALIDYGVR